ncbi:MAG: PIN domain nuclease, partial [Chthoniobacterales bacterium]
GSAQLRRALDLEFADLEDGMVASAAVLFGAQIIVTRNTRDYRKSHVRAMTPRDAVKLLG